MGNHAILSASSSHRWLHCLPSARLELEFENTNGEAAKEGTAAHALSEHKLKKALRIRSKGLHQSMIQMKWKNAPMPTLTSSWSR